MRDIRSRRGAARRDTDRTARLNGIPAAAPQGVPSAPVRLVQRVAMKLGRPARWVHADVTGPSRVLVRVDEFPHYRSADDPARYGTERFRRFHAILAGAGVPYLIAALPTVARDPLTPGLGDARPMDDQQAGLLARLPGEGVTVALHGYDHRTRYRDPRRHSELMGLDVTDLNERLDRGESILTGLGLPRPRVFVPPFNRFGSNQWATLAQRYDVVGGGLETVLEHGIWRTPSWRGDAVYLPVYSPLYGTARDVLRALDREETPGWVPVVLHWGWEADRGWRDLERLAARLATRAVAWGDFLNAVEASQRTDQ